MYRLLINGGGFTALATGTVKFVSDNAGPAATWLTALVGIIGIVGVLVRDVVRRAQRQEKIEEQLRQRIAQLETENALLKAPR
jgi:hypothetical protein